MQKKPDPTNITPGLVLEEVSGREEISISRDPVFGGDSLAFLTAKNVGLDSLLRILTRNLKFNEFVREVLLTLMRVVKSEAGSILEVDHREKHLFFRAVVGQSSDTLMNFKIPMGTGIAGFVAESLQPLVVDDLQDDKRHLKEIARTVGFETRNLIALPILIRGRIFGVLELLNRVGDTTYSQQDVELLTYLCEAAARSLEIRLMLADKRNGPVGIPNKDEAA